MSGRDRLAFRSKPGFCAPGVVEVLVLPVKMNAPWDLSRKKVHHSLYTVHIYRRMQISRQELMVKLPGVFVAEKVILTFLGFPPSAACGVLVATQGDMRAGVFTKDFLCSLSRVASENLHTHAIVKASH